MNALMESVPSQRLARVARDAARAAMVRGARAALDPLSEPAPAPDQEDALPVAMSMEPLGFAAAQAGSEAEACSFLAPLAGMAVKALAPKLANIAAATLPAVVPQLQRVVPALRAGVQGAATVLRGNGFNELLAAMPRLLRAVAADLARQYASGTPITRERALRTLAKQIAAMLGTPRKASKAITASAALRERARRAFPLPA